VDLAKVMRDDKLTQQIQSKFVARSGNKSVSRSLN